MIRTNLEPLVHQQTALLLVTSPSDDGEKSIITSKLALSIVEQGKKVLLVDGNIRKPSLNHWFKLPNEAGLTNVIDNVNEAFLNIQETFVPGLFVLPTGPMPVNPADVWMTGKINELVRYCEANFDVIIFEGPPFLTVSDSHILANQCDGVILVIKENKTKKKDVIKTKEYLERKNNQILGVIYQTG
ncbi:CpsD/CapB family tyrosine-protein kinase [Neobacillus sp. 19]